MAILNFGGYVTILRKRLELINTIANIKAESTVQDYFINGFIDKKS